MRKRERFIISSGFLSLCLLATQYIPLDFRLLGTTMLFFVSYAVSSWALWEELNGIEWFVVVPYPGLFAVSMSLFYFLLPENILSRIIILIAFGVGMYGIYLTCNIYSVAKARTIQLLRAAHAIGLYLTLIMTFLFSNTIFAYRWPFWANGAAILLITIPLALIQLWAVELKRKIEPEVWMMTISVALLMGQSAMALSFFPGSLWTVSLYLVGVMYTTIGILTTKITGKLFMNTVYEYAAVWGVIVLAFVGVLLLER